MKLTPWYPGTTAPMRQGWYERDYRGTAVFGTGLCKSFEMDWFEPFPENDAHYPGFWYGLENDKFQDAWYRNLSWRGIEND